MKPTFRHHCKKCQYQGTIYNGWDVYLHEESSGNTKLVLVWGSGHGEYSSVPMATAERLSGENPDYDEAIALIRANRSVK
jgi:hypothetical protein